MNKKKYSRKKKKILGGSKNISENDKRKKEALKKLESIIQNIKRNIKDKKLIDYGFNSLGYRFIYEEIISMICYFLRNYKA